jgi:hypothetical protein
MWGTDATAAVTILEGPATIFAAIDHCTAEREKFFDLLVAGFCPKPR